MLQTSGGNIIEVITRLRVRLDSPDLIVRVGESLAEKFKEAFSGSGLISRSGAGLEALTYVGQPQRTGRGWTIGVGKHEDLGDENQPAPTGTLREFFTDNPTLHPTPWRGIPPAYQDQLASMRRAGLYGGRGATYANYMWVQNAGNARAYITARHFIETGLMEWRSDVPDIIRAVMIGPRGQMLRIAVS